MFLVSTKKNIIFLSTDDLMKSYGNFLNGDVLKIFKLIIRKYFTIGIMMMMMNRCL